MLDFRRLMLFCCVYILFCNCSNKSERKSIGAFEESRSENDLDIALVNLLAGVCVSGDTSVIENLIVSNLNNSNYKEAAHVLMSNFTYDTVSHSGYWGLECRNKIDEVCSYLFFRLEDFQGNLPKEQLEKMLAISALQNSNLLYSIQEIEYAYIQNLNERDSTKASYIIKNGQTLLNSSKQRLRRIEFIVANCFFDVGKINDGLRLFDHLIEENYYTLPAYKRIIAQLDKLSKLNLLEKYTQAFKKKFPQESIVSELKNMSSETILKEMRSLSNNNEQRDLILARINLANQYFKEQNYEKVDSMIYTYFHNFHELTATDLLVQYQRGVFFDLQMRRYYVDRKYDSICDYSLTTLRENPVVVINSEEEFKEYIKRLYHLYTDKNLNGFEDFFRQNFLECQ